VRLYKDRELKKLNWVVDIHDENNKQIGKWGIQEKTIFEWLAYLTEEVGELSKAISEHYYRIGRKEEIKGEAIQVATLALKIAEMTSEEE
jgi:NTP pyrophosphatase (non-canonical NTP hydrolase)